MPDGKGRVVLAPDSARGVTTELGTEDCELDAGLVVEAPACGAPDVPPDAVVGVPPAEAVPVGAVVVGADVSLVPAAPGSAAAAGASGETVMSGNVAGGRVTRGAPWSLENAWAATKAKQSMATPANTGRTGSRRRAVPDVGAGGASGMSSVPATVRKPFCRRATRRKSTIHAGSSPSNQASVLVL